MTFANKYPKLRPTLLLDFAGSKTVDPRISFSRASSATYFDNKGVLRTAPANVPRIDYDPATGECRGLLVEEQRTNLLRYSEQIDNAYWVVVDATISANTVIAPDGQLTADKLVENTTSNNSHYVISSSTTMTSGATYVGSVYAKSGERSALQLTYQGGTHGSAYFANFNLANGTLGNSGGSGVAASITFVGNGWYRCSIAAPATTTAKGGLVAVVLTSTTAGRLGSYKGDGTSGVYIWGAQLEEGSFPTSYIPTTDSQVTRAADSASMTGTNFTDWANSVGTLLAKYKTAGWKHNNTLPVTQLDLTKSVDNYSTALAGDSIERLMFYPRQLTADQIAALKV